MEESECTSFQYDFDDNIALSVVFGLCFVIGLLMMFTGEFCYIFISKNKGTKNNREQTTFSDKQNTDN